VDAFAREPVATGPVGAPWTGFSLGVINAFFVRAANEAIGGDHGPNAVLFEESENLLADRRVAAHVGIFRKPAFERVRILTLVAHDADDYLRNKSCGWPIESDGSDRVALKALLGLPAQPWRRRLPILAQSVFSLAHVLNITSRVQLKHAPVSQMEIIRHFMSFRNRGISHH
jgi:hypothetical protein